MRPMIRFLPALPVVLALAACGSEPEPQPAPVEAVDANPATVEREADTPASTIPETTQIPERFIGVWDYVKGTCDPASDMRLAIGQDRFEFYESVGEVKAVRNEGEATVVDLAMEGEGETWDLPLRLVLKDGGERLHVTEPVNASDTDDYPRKRCPA
ncbi:MAG: hypothetical protein KJZ64_02180 [Sphingomonadaceae bacterium]|nr:hypothetical protein [Sphingomonadaceae bacterium]